MLLLIWWSYFNFSFTATSFVVWCLFNGCCYRIKSLLLLMLLHWILLMIWFSLNKKNMLHLRVVLYSLYAWGYGSLERLWLWVNREYKKCFDLHSIPFLWKLHIVLPWNCNHHHKYHRNGFDGNDPILIILFILFCIEFYMFSFSFFSLESPSGHSLQFLLLCLWCIYYLIS